MGGGGEVDPPGGGVGAGCSLIMALKQVLTAFLEWMPAEKAGNG